MTIRLHDFGGWTADQEFAVDQDRAVAYAAATNDDHPKHASGEVAPPLFAVVPVMPVVFGATPGLPAEYIPFILHGEQDMRFHAPIVPGRTLVSRAQAIGVRPTPAGTTIVVKSETRDGGTLLNEQWWTTFIRGVTDAEEAGEAAPGHRFPGGLKETSPAAEIAQKVDLDQTYRYSEASGDPMQIHLDEAFAKAAGLPGIIAHGLCTMAFTSRAIISSVGGNDPARLKRLAVRFSKVVLPGQELTTRIWDAGNGAYAFETTNPDGDAVITHGRAEIA